MGKSHRQQEETLWENLLLSLHIIMMMFSLEKTGITEILM